MKNINAKFFTENSGQQRILHKAEHFIDNNNWNYPNVAEAKFNIGFDSENIYLKFEVSEDNLCGFYTKYNEPVFEDSCVEFFISFDSKNYYNFEFNCIGTILGAYGTNRNNRSFIDEVILKKIKAKPSLGRNKIKVLDRKMDWVLEAVLPKEVFIFTEIATLINTKAKCNFYKCGDKLPEPHFLSWSPINTETPDFHQPDFFGEVFFNSTI